MAAVLAVTLMLEVQSSASRAGWLEHTDQVVDVADRIYRIRIDQETGLRAYLLTNNERFLQAYREGRDQARKLEDQYPINRLEMSAPYKHIKSGNCSDQAMDKYREARSEFAVGEQQLRDRRQTSSRRTLRFVNASVIALCLLLGGTFSVLGRRQLVNLSGAFNAALDTAQASAAEAQAQKEWSHTIFHSIGDAVIATDAEGTVTFMNPVAETLTG